MTIKNKLYISLIGLVSVAPKLSAMKPEMPELKAMNKLQSINYSENVSKINAVFEFLLSQEDAFISENKYPEILPFLTEDSTIINKALVLYLSHVSDLVDAKTLSSYRAASLMQHVLYNLRNILTDALLFAMYDFELYISTIASIYAEINQSQDITYQKSVLINGLKSIRYEFNILRLSNYLDYESKIKFPTSGIIGHRTNVYGDLLSAKEQLECIKFGFPKDSIQYILMNDDRDNLIEIMNQKSMSIRTNLAIDVRITKNYGYEYVNTISLIDLAALNGSVKCFQYLYSNDAVTDHNKTFDMAVIGGNIEIVQLLKHDWIGVESIMLAMRYCRYDIANWIYDSIDMSTKTMSAEDYSYCLSHANNNTILTKLMNSPKKSTIYFMTIMNSIISSDMLGFIIENSTSFPNIAIDFYRSSSFRVNNIKGYEPINIPKDNTVIDWAMRNGRIDILDVLIAKGADINDKNKDGETLLNIATNGSRYLIVKYLVSNGADINARDRYGDAPLHTAIRNGSQLIVEYLVSIGADINAKNKDGLTPLALAKLNGWKEIAYYLTLQCATE